MKKTWIFKESAESSQDFEDFVSKTTYHLINTKLRDFEESSIWIILNGKWLIWMVLIAVFMIISVSRVYHRKERKLANMLLLQLT